MEIKHYPFTLNLKHPFGVAGSTRTTTPVVFIEVSQDGCTGYGEASFPPYLKYTAELASEQLEWVRIRDIHSLNDIKQILDLNKDCLEPPAMAALDIALHDLLGKLMNVPVYKLYDAPSSLPDNCITLGIDSEAKIREKLEDTSGFNLLKIKLGGENDVATIKLVSSLTKRSLCVDVNRGWKTLETAISFLKETEGAKIIFIEQPFATEMINEMKALKKLSSIPLIADESFQSIDDLEMIAEQFDGINIKLMKCGGISNAFKIIEAARKMNLKILMGSMNESSCANLAAAHLGGLCDWTDLDGPFLIKNNPFKNPKVKDGKLILPHKPGLGLNKNINR